MTNEERGEGAAQAIDAHGRGSTVQIVERRRER